MLAKDVHLTHDNRRVALFLVTCLQQGKDTDHTHEKTNKMNVTVKSSAEVSVLLIRGCCTRAIKPKHHFPSLNAMPKSWSAAPNGQTTGGPAC